MINEIKGNIWDFYDKGEFICITTNGVVKNDGALVMGKGIALEAANRFSELPKYWGHYVKTNGNKVYPATKIRLFSFPTKHHWSDKSDINLIKASIIQLNGYLNSFYLDKIYIPRPGCGNGGLKWEEVKEQLSKMIFPPDSRMIFVSK